MMNIRSRLIVVKNTLPYIHPYSILDTETGEIIGQYRTITIAAGAIETIIEKFIDGCGHRKIREIAESLNYSLNKSDYNNPIQYYEERIKKPDGDKLPKQKNKPKRIVRIDDD